MEEEEEVGGGGGGDMHISNGIRFYRHKYIMCLVLPAFEKLLKAGSRNPVRCCNNPRISHSKWSLFPLHDSR